MSAHLIPTLEEFTVQRAVLYGPDARLHPSNRITSCGRHMSGLTTTTDPERATCKTCLKAKAPAMVRWAES